MKKKISISIAVIVLIVVVANLISLDFFARIDLSEDKSYTLSDATEKILKELEAPVTAKVYFSEGLPPYIANHKKNLKDFLMEYNTVSKKMFVYEFKNPNADEAGENEASQAGIQPLVINVREKDQMKQQKAFMGIVLSMEGREEVIPVLSPGTSVEYEITRAVKKLSVTQKPAVGLLQGHGEPGPGEISQIYNELGYLYDVEPVSLTDSTSIPSRIKTLILLNSKDTFSSIQLSKLDSFMTLGGKMLVAYNRVNAGFDNGFVSELNTNLEKWLEKYGIKILQNCVTDIKCGTVQVQQNNGVYNFISTINLPYFANLSSFSKHPVTGGLESVMFPFVSSLEFNGNNDIVYNPIVFSSDKSGIEDVPFSINVNRQWSESDFIRKNIPVAAAVESKNMKWKMIVIGDGDFMINGSGERANQLMPDNVNLAVNSVDWLSDETGLVDLRSKGITSRPIDNLEDGTKTFLKYLNLLLPILLVLGFGFYRYQKNRSLRLKRMEENYV